MLFNSTKGSKCGVVVWTCSNLCAKSNCVQTLLAIIVPSDMHWFSVSRTIFSSVTRKIGEGGKIFRRLFCRWTEDTTHLLNVK